VDAFRLSTYLYKDRSQKLCAGPLWDFDRSQGTSYGGDVRCFNPRLWYVQASGDQGTDYFGNPSLEASAGGNSSSPIPTSGSNGLTAGPTCAAACSPRTTSSPWWTA